MLKLPKPKGNDKEKLKEIVRWVERNLEDTRLSIRDLAKLGQRTPSQIIRSGKLPASFGCLDKAAVIGTLLVLNGFDAYLVSERAYHRKRSFGIHFSVQAKRGENKFTVDPHTLKTHISRKWFERKRSGTLTFTIHGNKNVTYKRILREKIPENALAVPSFKIAGIKNRRHYLRLTKVKPITFLKFVKSRSSKQITKRIERAKPRVNRR